MKKIILFLFLIAGVFVSAEAQTRPAHPPRTFNQERHRPHNRIRHLDRRQKAHLIRIHRRNKMRRQMRSAAMQYEHTKLYTENSKKAA